MPVPEVEALGKDSTDAQAKAAVSACIATEIRSGRDADQAKGMCYSMVEEKIGRNLPPAGGGG
jgi:hypothetical protein